MGNAGENIRRLREEAKMTQQDVSALTGLSVKYLSRIENSADHVSAKVARKMAACFGVEEMVVQYGERDELKEKAPSVPEHLVGLMEEIKGIFPDSYSLIRKSDKIAKVMRDLREGED